ncbi:MAG: twin-arginine translocase subunit TatC [Lentisphaerae bacterium]|jgi:sec-independent protein translocase protein TatC|nr:twin-arginine translocase subunit TatC [Lentisphaerota bacterium]MBT4818411.1 twin-arginine translocase subunit TatC [Lentisphaerota bacterium]MBT5610689.1 twin-arginine translocase subunit TatC [Lentisphaerota bacterium]MBT7058045.1 twin-arginine translocase subunit TatC [Lentisphaerota bacterium]MBT7840667.1 twin-arginine translocase subunit TatC [Lentisphaerota bacterium]
MEDFSPPPRRFAGIPVLGKLLNRRVPGHDNEKNMPLWEHLEELRWAIIKSLVVLFITTSVALAFTEPIYDILLIPLADFRDQIEITFAKPLDAFLIKMTLALLGGIFLALPFMLAFAWSFIAPGLTSRERKAVWLGVGWGVVFFACGVTFGYSLLPMCLKFLVAFGRPDVQQLWPLQVYIAFCFRLLLGFGIVFQLPVILNILIRLDLVTVETLTKGRPYAVIIAFVIAAILTPPDVFTQVLMALPLLALFEISLITGRWHKRKQADSEDDDALPDYIEGDEP